ncbi:MocR-like pyridoxine biosynthesis transcription factor PdxR [Humibacter sp.]|uniref:MocR-like pyridoxine biosynthesis transcription factor PdxR n=1 Tax=Humibacter sp. TaxID=1940291 RepID=UPI003F7FA9C6
MTDAWANSPTEVSSVAGIDLHLVVDPRRKTDSLEAAMRDMIRDGRLASGTRMPATRSLARDLGIARNSVAEVYGRLVGEGWLEARTGAGTWVAHGAGSSARIAAADDAGPPVQHAGAGIRLDLRAGIPDTSGFPRSAWASAMRRAVSAAPVSAFGYGDPAGVEPLRRALATYLGRARGVVADPSAVHVTHGAGHAVRLVGRALVAAGARRVAVEEYGHQPHRHILAALGLEVVPLPVDDSGADVERLGDLNADAVLLTPAHQFPIGVALSPARRAAVVQWTERTGGLVIEDDYDGEFRFDRRAIGALQSLSPDRVVYVGTASKALGPGIGLGWCVLPRTLVAAVAEERHLDGAKPGALAQLALAEFLDRGDYDRAVRSARARYRARRQYLERAVAERMPAARVTGMPAGLHCLLELPDGIQESDVMRRADAVGIAFDGLQTYRMPAREPVRAEGVAARPPAMVVGFGAPPPHLFEQAVEAALAAIAAASRRYRGRARSPAPSARQSERARSALASVADNLAG